MHEEGFSYPGDLFVRGLGKYRMIVIGGFRIVGFRNEGDSYIIQSYFSEAKSGFRVFGSIVLVQWCRPQQRGPSQSGRGTSHPRVRGRARRLY